MNLPSFLPLRHSSALHKYRLTLRHGPFVYRLGRQVFNLERGVRFPYGLPPKLEFTGIRFGFIRPAQRSLARSSIG